jgi:hypothetical protein
MPGAEESVIPGLFEARDREGYSNREYYFSFVLRSYSRLAFTFLRENGLPIPSLQAVGRISEMLSSALYIN